MTATNQTGATLQVRTLGTAYEHDTLRGYLGMCPTCFANPMQVVDEYTDSVVPAICPTCGHASVEYGMVIEMDAILARLNGLDALAAAVETHG